MPSSVRSASAGSWRGSPGRGAWSGRPAGAGTPSSGPLRAPVAQGSSPCSSVLSSGPPTHGASGARGDGGVVVLVLASTAISNSTACAAPLLRWYTLHLLVERRLESSPPQPRRPPGGPSCSVYLGCLGFGDLHGDRDGLGGVPQGWSSHGPNGNTKTRLRTTENPKG